MQLLQLFLVEEAFGGYVDEVVAGQVYVLEVPVELEGRIYGFDFVVAKYQALDGWVKGDGEDVEFAVLALDDEGFIVAGASCRATDCVSC